MLQKTAATLDHKLVDAKGKALPYPLTTLSIEGEISADTPLIYQVLAALLDKDNPPEVDVEFEASNGRVTYSLQFSHEDNILQKGKEEHDLTVAAENARMTVPAYKQKLADAEKPAAAKEAEKK